VTRDRIALSVLAAAAVVAGFWFAILAPKREDVRRMDAALTAQRQRLDHAQASASNARAARARYDADYSAVVMLGKAVPQQDGVPSLLYQIDASARDAKVDFSSITSDAGTAGSGTSATGAAATTTPATGTTPAGATGAVAPTPMPLSFVFNGSFFDMEHMLERVHDFVRTSGSGVAVSGRLLTVDDIALQPASEGFPRVQATISASAYTMPAPTTPAGGTAAAAAGTATPASATAATTSTTATGTTP
jgi:Tfp pilus assembly protein PilO